MNIQEDYVSFETAKLLKEKGFDEICYLGYNKNGEYFPTSNRTNSQIIQPDFCFICCPTLQMVMKWLRDVHKLHCDIGYDDLSWFWNIISVSDDIPVEDRPKLIKDGYAGLLKYEEACEAAIKYCLENLI